MRRTGIVAAIVGILLVGSSTPGVADLDGDLARIDRQVGDLESRVSSVRSERTDLANQILDTADRLDSLTADLAAARDRLDETERDIAITEARVADLDGRIDERQVRLDRLRSDIEDVKADAVERAVEMYMRGERSPALAVFEYQDVADMNVGVVYTSRAQEVAERTIASLQNLSALERSERERLAVERDELETEAERLEFRREERADAAELVESRAGEVAAQLAVQEEQLAELQHEIEHIEGEIAALEREQDQIKALILRQSGQGGTRPGALLRPVPGGVSSGYGYRIHPIYGTPRLHTGWDMNAACGDPIRAAESGTVIYSGWKGGYGNAIIIDHGGGLSTLYGHQSSLGAGYGVSVSVGDVIGWIGTTGVSTGCHLHFEVRVSGNPVDPTPYM